MTLKSLVEESTELLLWKFILKAVKRSGRSKNQKSQNICAALFPRNQRTSTKCSVLREKWHPISSKTLTVKRSMTTMKRHYSNVQTALALSYLKGWKYIYEVVKGVVQLLIELWVPRLWKHTHFHLSHWFVLRPCSAISGNKRITIAEESTVLRHLRFIWNLVRTSGRSLSQKSPNTSEDPSRKNLRIFKKL